MNALKEKEVVVDKDYPALLKEAYAPIKAEKEAALAALRLKEEIEKAAAANAKKLGIMKGMSQQTVTRCQSEFDKVAPEIQGELKGFFNELVEFNQTVQGLEDFTSEHQLTLKTLSTQFNAKLKDLTTPKLEAVENPLQISNAFVEGVNYKSEIQKQHDLLDAQKSAQIPSVKHRKEQQDAFKAKQAYGQAKEARIREAMTQEEELLNGAEIQTLQTIQSFRGKGAKDVFYAAEPLDAALQNTLKNLNASKSLQAFRDTLSPGAQFKSLENIKITWNNEECTLMSLRMNEQYRIYFFWSQKENKALRVFYGDLHHKESTLRR